MSDDLLELVLLEFTKVANRYEAPRWAELRLWETIEGRRKSPCPFLPPLSDEELDALRILRDEYKLWVVLRNDAWVTIPLDEWLVIVAQEAA